MTPNVWLTDKENPRKEIENLEAVSPQDNVNEMFPEPGLSPFPKGKKERVQPPNKINCNSSSVQIHRHHLAYCKVASRNTSLLVARFS